MSDQAHRGAAPRGPATRQADRRVLELDEALRGVEAISGVFPAFGLFRDPARAAAARLHALGGQGRFYRGTVVHALPGVNWYKVQVGDGAGWVAACLLSAGTLMPHGPRDVGMAGPNDDVLLFKPPGLNHAFILGVIPPYATGGSVLVPDWIVQAGGSGLRREAGHKFPIKSLYKGGGVVDWSCQRPLDQTPLDRGWVTPLGLALTVDDAMIQARVSESAGLWMTFFDEWVRLAGRSLLIESPAHELEACDDEGEPRYFLGIAGYSHEALGRYAPGEASAERTDPVAVQYGGHRADLDLPAGGEDAHPAYRYQQYGGYLGQGGLRFVARPAGTSGPRRYADADREDTGLFLESIGFDGDYFAASAKSYRVGRRARIVVPRQKAPAASAAGDDAAAGNYKAASLHGAAADHAVGDVAVPAGLPRSILGPQAALDLAAYRANWKALHPFHYHAADYAVPRAGGAQTGVDRVQEFVDFAGDGFRVADPEPVPLRVDHRYGDVAYFLRENFLHFHEDGSVQLTAGAGEEIVMAGGRVTIDAPLGVDVRSGGDATTHAAQVIIKARGSVDVSSSAGDVRAAAAGNMQLASGTSGRGGMLLDARGRGTAQDYRNRFGEDVGASGLVLRAAGGPAAVLAQDIYLRTGGDSLGAGDILIDAGRGDRGVRIVGRDVDLFPARAVTFGFGPTGEASAVRRAYRFTDSAMLADVGLRLGGRLVAYAGGGGPAGIVVDGGVQATGSISTSGSVSDRRGGTLGQVPQGFASTVAATAAASAEAAETVRAAAEAAHRTAVAGRYYAAGGLGSDALLADIGFSFRDPPGPPVQYGTESFLWPEARWQQLVRYGMGSGGTAWTERPVVYQGRETYPWPGRAKWVEEDTFVRLSSATLFDPATGADADRPGPYEHPEVAAPAPVPPDGEYTLIR